MQALQLIKTHLVALLCGVVAVAAVVFAALGMSSVKVVNDMQEVIRDTGAASIGNLKSKPQNEDTIAKEKERGEKFQKEYTKTLEVAHRINSRVLLMDGVFPEPRTTTTPFAFREAYRKAMKVLPTKVDAETLPTVADIQEEAQNVEDLLLLEAEQKAEEEEEEGGRTPPVIAPRVGRYTPLPPLYGGGRTAPPGMPGRVGPGISGRMPPGMSGRMGPGMPEPTGRTPVSTRIPTAKSGEPKYDPTYRAQVAKAKSILCYYDETSFHHSPLEYEQDAPAPEKMWYAQVVAWVQEDVVQALKELNQEAARQVTAGDACVEHVPVKRIVAVRVLGYEVGGAVGRVAFPQAQGAELPADVWGPSLTGRKSNEEFDVVRFVLSVVVDQRDVLQLIDRVSRVNFYQCLSASYEAVDHQQERMRGYFYGTDPVVRATLEFEGYMARELYAKWMPPTVRQMLGIKTEGEGE